MESAYAFPIRNRIVCCCCVQFLITMGFYCFNQMARFRENYLKKKCLYVVFFNRGIRLWCDKAIGVLL